MNDDFRPQLFVDGIRFVFENASEVGAKTLEHLLLSRAAIGIALLVAVPVGAWLGHLHRGAFLTINVGNVGRALPSLALIAFGLPFFGIGFTNVLVALVVLAVPPILLNAYVAVDSVDRDAVEAARGMGMTDAQILRRIELPLALPVVLAGLRVATVSTVALATVGTIVANGGLGDLINHGRAYDFKAELFTAAVLCVALALVLDVLLLLGQRLLTPWTRAKREAIA